MSVWRIAKIDAQTRVLAEAAAKAAGLPLGVWIERAIMRRASDRRIQEQIPLPPLAAEVPAAPEVIEPKISAEMQAALDAAERRRRARAGEAAAPDGTQEMSGVGIASPAANSPAEPELPAEAQADPFAAPEKISDETPFEQPPVDGPIEGMPEIEDEALIVDDEAIAAAPVLDEIVASEGVPPASADLPDLSGILKDAGAMAVAAESHEISIDSAGRPVATAMAVPEGEFVTTTPREALRSTDSPSSRQRRTPSALPFLLGGIAVVLAGAGGAYVYLTGLTAPQDNRIAPPSVASANSAKPATPPTQAAPPPVQQPAPTPASAPRTPAPPDRPVPPVNSAAVAAAPSAALQAAPTRPLAVGPSMANLATVDSPAPAPAASDASPAPAAPPAASSVAGESTTKTAAANEALPALRARADAGEIEAQLELGRRYIQGIGVGRNDAEAAKWLLRAAEQGDAQAQFNVGVMYERGVGLAANAAKAIEFYRRSAAQNTPMALHNLALLHAAGAPGLKANPPEALRLMTRAAGLGQVESQYSLSLMHLQGIGTPVDRIAAMAWLAIAARGNQPQLVEAAKQLSAQLSAADRARAQSMAQELASRIAANIAAAQAAASSAPVAAAPAAAPAAPRDAAEPKEVDRAAIVEMQNLLATLKIYGGKADGAMGPRTAAAIREFQTMAGLPVDGKPSIPLLESLRDIAQMTKQ